MRKRWRKLMVIALSFVVLFIGVTAFLYGMQNTMLAEEVQPASCVVVLGCALYDDLPSPMLSRRLAKGLELYQAGVAPDIILCGGKGSDEKRPEAAAMAEYYIENGVPEANLHLDDTSMNTWENLTNAHSIMEEKGFTNAVIVSSEFHLPRIRSFAEQMGLTAQYAGSNSEPFIRLYYTYREIASVVKNTFWH